MQEHSASIILLWCVLAFTFFHTCLTSSSGRAFKLNVSCWSVSSSFHLHPIQSTGGVVVGPKVMGRLHCCGSLAEPSSSLSPSFCIAFPLPGAAGPTYLHASTTSMEPAARPAYKTRGPPSAIANNQSTRSEVSSR